MKKKIIIMAVAILVIIPLLAGCSPVTMRGGGWLPYYGMPDQNGQVINEPEGKTTFSFTVESYNIEGSPDPYAGTIWSYEVRGRLRYNDRKNGIRINGIIEDAGYLDVDGCIFTTKCVIDGTDRAVTVVAFDNSNQGTDDIFGIIIYEGLVADDAYIEFMNYGPIGKGNITLFYP